MPLGLDSHIMRSVISTPSRLVGELVTPDLRLQIVLPSGGVDFQTAVVAGPYSRSYYLLSVEVPDDPSKPGEFAVPVTTSSDGRTSHSYGAIGEMLTDLASVWYGKRFDYHGVIIHDSIVRLPDLSCPSPVRHHELGFYNRKPRPDLDIELTLQALGPVIDFLHRQCPEKELDAFWTAAHFYARALRAFNNDPEAAFFYFIVALEVVASQIDVPYEDLYDEKTRKDLEEIKDKCGPELANRVRHKYFQLRRKVVYAANDFVNDAFFQGSQAEPEWARLSRENLNTRVGRAYDLRSKYVHSGIPFGIWVDTIVIPGAEVQVGRPVLPDSQGKRKLERILADIPTFAGLERLVRFVILSFANRRIDEIHATLR